MNAPDKMQSLPVGADMLCVPDNTGYDAAKLGLSIQCSPRWIGSDKDAIGNRFTAELATWPSAIHKQQAVEVFVTADLDGENVSRLNKTNCITYQVMTKGWREKADILWAKAFRYDKDQSADFEPLWRKLKARAEEVQVLSDGPLLDRHAAMVVDFIEQVREARSAKTGDRRVDKDDLLRDRMQDLWDKIDAKIEGKAQSPAKLGSASDDDRNGRIQKAINDFFSPDPVALSIDASDVLVSMFSTFLAQFSEGVDKQDESAEGETEARCPTPEESAEIKLNAILDVPSLAHFFGCGVYVDLDPDEIISVAGPQGFIAARFAPPSGSRDLPDKNELVWTAYAIDLKNDLQRFSPRAQPSVGDNPDYVGEFLNLRQLMRDKQCLRYRLSQISPEASVLGEVVARQIAKRRGEKRDPMALLHGARRRGIALWDKEAAQSAREAGARFADQSNVYYLDDLVRGVRPDIQAKGGDMYCPTTRSIRCKDTLFPQEFYQDEFVRQFLLYRDHAYTQDPVITQEQGQSKSAEKRGALFIYLGEPIGLGRDDEAASDCDHTVSTIDACRGLALNIEFGPDSPDRLADACLKDKQCADQLKWPTLREGSSYRVGCRLAYVNGAGPGRDYLAVRKAYASGVPTLGSSEEQDLLFEAVQVEPPRVLLHQFDELIGGDRGQYPGSSANCVVLAHSNRQFRVVLPPALSLDQAEQQGQFDGINEPSVAAAFGGKLLLGGDGVSLPEARYRGLFFVDGNIATEAVQGKKKETFGEETGTLVDERQSLGPVAHFTPKGGSKTMYFVDRNAKGFTVALCGEPLHSVSYRDGSTPVPRVLDVRQVERSVSHVTVTDATDIDIDPGRNATRLDGATIHVPAGRRVSVDLIPTTETPQSTLRRTVLTIVSPIKKPDAPTDGEPYGVSARYVDAPDPKTLISNLGCQVAPDKGTPMASVALFEGALEVDARATGRLILDVAWEDWSAQGWYPDCEKKRRDGTCSPDNTAYRFATRRQRSPLPTIDARFEDGTDQRKLIKLAECAVENGQHRVTLPFNEGLARELDLTVTAESEFSSYYPGSNAAGTTSSVTLRVNLACSFRGKPLQIASDDPILKWQVEKFDRRVGNAPKVSFEGRRGEKRRIYLEGELFVTGIGECVGVIVPDDKQLERMAKHDGFVSYVSQIGLDPHFQKGKLPERLTPEMLGGHLCVKRDVVIVINDDQQNSREGLVDPFTSDVVLFQYQLDEEKRPYIEIDVSDLAATAHRPVLHLGLVRFQPNALHRTEDGGQKRRIDLRASKPIRKDVKLLPERRYGWKYGGGSFEVWLKGEMVEPRNVELHRYVWAKTIGGANNIWCWERVDTLQCAEHLQDGKVMFRTKDLSHEDIQDAGLRRRVSEGSRSYPTLFRIEENETYKNFGSGKEEVVGTFAASIYPHDEYLPN